MDYSIQILSSKLVYIRWYQSPVNQSSEVQYLHDLSEILDKATEPVYILSDLRHGRISNMKTLRALADMACHPNWVGSTAFSGDPVTSIMVNMFSHMSHRSVPSEEHWRTPEEALAYLESKSPGITRDIAWHEIFGLSSHQDENI